MARYTLVLAWLALIVWGHDNVWGNGSPPAKPPTVKLEIYPTKIEPFFVEDEANKAAKKTATFWIVASNESSIDVKVKLDWGKDIPGLERLEIKKIKLDWEKGIPGTTGRETNENKKGNFEILKAGYNLVWRGDLSIGINRGNTDTFNGYVPFRLKYNYDKNNSGEVLSKLQIEKPKSLDMKKIGLEIPTSEKEIKENQSGVVWLLVKNESDYPLTIEAVKCNGQKIIQPNSESEKESASKETKATFQVTSLEEFNTIDPCTNYPLEIEVKPTKNAKIGKNPLFFEIDLKWNEAGREKQRKVTVNHEVEIKPPKAYESLPVWAGIVFGLIFRTVFPWLTKKPKEKFKLRYAFPGFIAGLILALITIVSGISSTGDPVKDWITAFLAAYGSQDFGRSIDKLFFEPSNQDPPKSTPESGRSKKIQRIVLPSRKSLLTF